MLGIKIIPTEKSDGLLKDILLNFSSFQLLIQAKKYFLSMDYTALYINSEISLLNAIIS